MLPRCPTPPGHPTIVHPVLAPQVGDDAQATLEKILLAQNTSPPGPPGATEASLQALITEVRALLAEEDVEFQLLLDTGNGSLFLLRIDSASASNVMLDGVTPYSLVGAPSGFGGTTSSAQGVAQVAGPGYSAGDAIRRTSFWSETHVLLNTVDVNDDTGGVVVVAAAPGDFDFGELAAPPPVMTVVSTAEGRAIFSGLGYAVGDSVRRILYTDTAGAVLSTVYYNDDQATVIAPPSPTTELDFGPVKRRDVPITLTGPYATTLLSVVLASVGYDSLLAVSFSLSPAPFYSPASGELGADIDWGSGAIELTPERSSYNTSGPFSADPNIRVMAGFTLAVTGQTIN